MSPRRTGTSRRFRSGVALALLLLVPAAARAQKQEYVVPIQGSGFKRIPLRVLEPEFATSDGTVRRAAQEARDILARDLIYAGLFYVSDGFGNVYTLPDVPRAWNVANETPDRKPQDVAAQWSSEAGQLVAELRLLDPLGTQIAGKRYKVEPAGVRGAMHHFADEVVKRLTGVEGTAQTKIAFARVRGDVADIYTVDYDGFNERQVTNGRTLSHSPVWGPGWIAFTSYVDQNPSLYRIDAGSSRPRVVSRYPGLNTAPDWCPGKELFAVTLSHEGNAEIYTMRGDGSGTKRLTHHPAIDTAPSWSPNCDQIAFTSDRSGIPQIYVMDGDGGNARRLTFHNRYSDSPAWSPDGRYIAYVARWEAGIELRVMKPDGGDQRVVVNTGYNDSPSWARNSRNIVFSSLRGGTRSIYVVDAYSTLERRLTSGPHDAITPAWSRN